MRFTSLAAVLLVVSMPVAAVAQTAPQAGQSAPQAAPAAPAAVTPSAPRGNGPQDAEAKARFEKFQAACGADLKSHCAGIERSAEKGRAEMRQCIETNKTKFSAACQSAVAEREAARAARKDAQPAALEKPKS